MMSNRIVQGEKGKVNQLRVLCLHGYGSNNDISALQTRFLQFEDKHDIICDYFRGNIEVKQESERMKAFSEKPFYTWFTGETDRERAEGLWECLKELKQIIEEYGPYDGIYGFSFGALLATILASEDTWQELFGQGIQIRFVLLACAGGYSRYIKSAFYKNNIELPSFHILGDKDQWKETGYNYSKHYKNPIVYTHAYGHEIPMKLLDDIELQNQLTLFLQNISKRT